LILMPRAIIRRFFSIGQLINAFAEDISRYGLGGRVLHLCRFDTAKAIHCPVDPRALLVAVEEAIPADGDL